MNMQKAVLASYVSGVWPTSISAYVCVVYERSDGVMFRLKNIIVKKALTQMLQLAGGVYTRCNPLATNPHMLMCIG